MADGLYRSRRERMIGGVAGGIAESLRIDPTIVRVGWVVLALLTNGLLVLVYLVLLFVIPEAPDDVAIRPEAGAAASDMRATSSSVSTIRTSAPPADRRTGALVAGAILILLGGYFLVRRFIPAIDLAATWPFIAVGLGIVLVLASLRPGRR